ncbi:GL18522 [Drosophila persimilis]|uniref:GL18522 n=1 Tax=Drosophila persimilis TaxID=7234 RepID=B4G729_DROPE|nr:uncharacterized protein LOC6589113 [Drosophila persimilis]EDW29228.1 GL18522 [Drosophila persimilis]
MSIPRLAGEVLPHVAEEQARPDNALIRIEPRQVGDLQAVAVPPTPPAALMGPLAVDGSAPVLLPILDYVRELLAHPFPREPESTDYRLHIASHRQRLLECITTVVGILRNVMSAMARDSPLSAEERRNFQKLRTLYFSAFDIGNSLRRTIDAAGHTVYSWPRHYVVMSPGLNSPDTSFGGSSMLFPWRNPYLFTPHLGAHYFERGMEQREAHMEREFWDEHDYLDEASTGPPDNVMEDQNNGTLEERGDGAPSHNNRDI